VARRKTASEVRLISADTYEKLVTSVDKQEERLAALRDELDEMRARILHLENEAHELTTRLRILEQYTRRLVKQLRSAGMTPDIPQDVIDELFSGSASGAGV
jgi:predicted  nucleic acid-binding Zn-ribbon protein